MRPWAHRSAPPLTTSGLAERTQVGAGIKMNEIAVQTILFFMNLWYSSTACAYLSALSETTCC